ncbi:MAG: orotate phosphoribosyltransferase [Candidatus Bathyarchaeota archaeon]|nr:orotate phosphoribosyltransferase [Candidatus Bathyarchaeota archaeon]MDP7207432.1 orotate phosphoribosyltransferase [Candidatus Bathyarchaeota archaeon]
MSDRQLLVSKIENGIVIDHIPAGKAFLVLKLLKVDPSVRALIAQNVESRSQGTKDFIKIEGSYLTSREVDLIAFVAPKASINIIEDWTVKEKRRVHRPEHIEGIFKCPNPLCLTNAQYTPPRTRFKVEGNGDVESIKLYCSYCGSILYYGSILEDLKGQDFILEGGGLVSKERIEQVFLDILVRKGALRLLPSPDEPFILKSGRPSPYFVNLGALTDGESLAAVKWAFASYIVLLMEQGSLGDFDYVFGPSYKGIGLAALTCEGLNELYGMDKRYMYDRKEAKDYGDISADKVIVGASYFQQGQRILVVDDTMTTGTTKVESIEKLKLLGDHEVAGIILAVDRHERMGDTENVEELSAVQYLEDVLGLNVFSIQNIKTIYSLIKDSLDKDIRELWLDYYDKYGVEKLE